MSLVSHAARLVARSRYRLVDDLAASPRPDDAPHAHAPGVDPDRVLVLGNGPAVGWGVRSHDLALPGHLARKLSALTGRGADVDALAAPSVTIATARDLLAVRSIRDYDAVVVVVGLSDALRLVSVERWSADLCALLGAVDEETDPSCHVVVMAVHAPSSVPKFTVPVGGHADQHAELMNEAARALCAGRDRTHFLLPPAPPTATAREVLGTPGRGTGGGDGGRQVLRYADWAAGQAALLAPLLDAELERGGTARSTRHAPQDEAVRLQAIRELGLLDSPHEQRFDELVERARVLLGTQGAAFSVIGDGRHWNKAISGSSQLELPIADSFCAHTIRSGRPLVVPDAWNDARFVSHPSVRFYAGHPIETAEGVRIGALCVVDAEPRSGDGVDLVLLRELAMQVQRELRTSPATAGP